LILYTPQLTIARFGFFIDNQNLNVGSILQRENFTSVPENEFDLLFIFAQDVVFPPIVSGTTDDDVICW